MGLRGLKFYTVKEVAVIMQVRIETVLRWIYARKLKASKLPSSRIWRIREEDIIEFMEQGLNINDDTLNVASASLEDEIEEQEERVVVSTLKPVESKPKTKTQSQEATTKKVTTTKKGNDMFFDFSNSKIRKNVSSIDMVEEISEEEVIEENIISEEEHINYGENNNKAKNSSYNLDINNGTTLFCDVEEGSIDFENVETVEIF